MEKSRKSKFSIFLDCYFIFLFHHTFLDRPTKSTHNCVFKRNELFSGVVKGGIRGLYPSPWAVSMYVDSFPILVEPNV